MTAEYMAYLLKYDSVHGELKDTIQHLTRGDENFIVVNGELIPVFAFEHPQDIPWGKMGIDIVLETSGAFRNFETCSEHLKAGAKKVIISAPAKEETIPTLIYGVNHEKYDSNSMDIISMASCTSNCAITLLKLVHDKYTILEGLLSTIHAGTEFIHRQL
jgi:glyceraldehyde 3-phosphate dehydrogenase